MTSPTFSIFTPTHNTVFLRDSFRSILEQTFCDWEWVIVTNRGARVPDDIAQHQQVRVFAHDPERPGHIGTLKNFACGRCRGRYLVELDHDDLLTNWALETANQAITDTNADFLYSDSTYFFPNGENNFFHEERGWDHYQEVIDGEENLVIKAFPVTPSSLASILYAPDHVRIWKRSFYEKIGGHNSELAVCDDYDLVCRSYLAGGKFHHITRCLYRYRLQNGDSNTHVQRNNEIRTAESALSTKYTEEIISEWARREGKQMIDLGGAHNCPPGFTSVDIDNADICCDIRLGLPFEDSSIACIRACDFLEHIPTCQQANCSHDLSQGPLCVVGVMNEIYRVLVPGGWLISRTPSTDGRGAFQDPTHVSFWNENSFWYYTRREQANFIRGLRARFQAKRLEQAFPSKWHEAHNILYVYADLVALKGQREPGISQI